MNGPRPVTERDVRLALAKEISKERRAFRATIAQTTDADLTSLLHYYDYVIRTQPNVALETGRVTFLRACRHEAVIVRNWDAHDDPRVTWGDFDAVVRPARYRTWCRNGHSVGCPHDPGDGHSRYGFAASH